AAEKIEQGLVPLVSREQQDRGGEVFLERRVHGLDAVAAAVHDAVGIIEADGGLILPQEKIEAHIRRFFVYGGAGARLFAEVVHYRVLKLERRVMAVGDGRV